MDIYIIGATPLIRLAKKPKHMIFTITIANIKKALVLKRHTNLTIKVLVEYYKYLDAFSRKEADKLAKHQLYNYKIILKEGRQPGFKPLYGMSRNKL